MLIASMALMVVGVEAVASSSAPADNAFDVKSPQIDRILRQVTRRRRQFRNKGNNKVSYETRTVWKGNKEYRDTYRITWKNGFRHEKRIERVRIR